MYEEWTAVRSAIDGQQEWENLKEASIFWLNPVKFLDGE